MKRFSVRQWGDKKALQASSMSCGACTETTGLVGIDMVAQDGRTFAHGHFDVETARLFHRQLGDAIEEAATANAPSGGAVQ